MDVPHAIGKYEIIARIGRGGMAEVFLARRTGAAGFEKKVALKLLAPHASEDKAHIQSLINEATLVACLSHPNLVQVFEFELIDRSYCMTMEYIDGVTLDAVLNRCRTLHLPIPHNLILFIAMEVCAGLDYAHSATDDNGTSLHLIHRDVKPSNIMISRQGQIKLMDFGIAKSAINPYKTTQNGGVKGTLAYMSPEQITGSNRLGPQTDLYSLGVILYEAITLERLFDDSNLFKLAVTVQQGLRPEAKAKLQAQFPEIVPTLDKLLQLEPSDRFADARGLIFSLRKVQPTATALEMAEFLQDLGPMTASAASQGTVSTSDPDRRLVNKVHPDIISFSGNTPIAPPASAFDWGEDAEPTAVSPERASPLPSTVAKFPAPPPPARDFGDQIVAFELASTAPIPADPPWITSTKNQSSASNPALAAHSSLRKDKKSRSVQLAFGGIFLLFLFVVYGLGTGSEEPVSVPATPQESPSPSQNAPQGTSSGKTATSNRDKKARKDDTDPGRRTSPSSPTGSMPDKRGTAKKGSENNSADIDAADMNAADINATDKKSVTREDASKQPSLERDVTAPLQKSPPEKSLPQKTPTPAPPPQSKSSSPASSVARTQSTKPAADAENTEEAIGEGGTLVVNSQPWSNVIIDGKPKGVTPKILKLAPGDYAVTLQQSDGVSKTFNVTIEQGKETYRIWSFNDNKWETY